MFSFERLQVWEKIREFVREIYKITVLFPKEEQFGLSQHIRKSAISILSNISEATSRFGDNDFKRFIELAIGSLYETMSQLFVALDNNYLNKKSFDNLYKEAEIIAKMLSKLSKSRGS
ncbi:MAG: four helix bundle protein [Candidatus Omnitrophica bacterium]|nr:four helix bundle protein [Candidatus Omnitrophota bacterium]MCM8826969.1 four helix bundle protein [Candidatus Omnitrophota bacterium]